jgi:hypothetical protein
MADIKISGLPTATTATTADILPIVQSGTTKQLTNALLFTSPTLVTPVLGTPASGSLDNCTNLPVATGISGFAAGVASFLATPSSANFRTMLTDETGTGLAVFATTPTFTGMPRIPTATVAATGSTQGTAASITTGFTLVSAADGTKGVVLTSSTATGDIFIVKNSLAFILKVYPALGGAINGGAANAAYSMAASTAAIFIAYNATTIYTIPLVAS